ncbi:MAG TPA: hypothetical protein VNU72_12455 [Puia sp.]|jgi:hypothetical protein|nr:hypothetical protein [Puia sp.]
MRRLFTILLFVAPLTILAQDITGVWQGHFRSTNIPARSSMFDERYKFEVQFAQRGKELDGVTYSYLSSIFYAKAALSGKVNVHTGKILIQEGKILEVRNSMGDICVMTCFLQYSKSGDEEFLEGTYVSMNARDSSNCGKGTVFLRKVVSSDFYEEPSVVKREKEIASPLPKAGPVAKNGAAKKVPPAKTGTTAPRPNSTAKTTTPPRAKTTTPPGATVKKTPAPGATVNKTAPTGATARTTPKPKSVPLAPEKSSPSVSRMEIAKQPKPAGDSTGGGIGRKYMTIVPPAIRTRSNPVVKSLVVHTNEVELNIYDDGAIDHDTISVYLDNRLVIDHAMLTDRPIVLILHLDDTNDYHEIVMVAENEGEIPPNTSLMIVKAGDKEYEVRITSTEQKNAVVTFKYEKPK